MKLEPARETQFDEKQLYFQWLHTRSAVPLKITKYFIWGLWVLAVIFFIIVDQYSIMGSSFLPVLVPIILFAAPPILTLLYFMYFIPKALNDDAQTGLLGFINSSPLPTGDMVSGLRKFFTIINLKILAPPVMGLFMVSVKEDAFGYFSGEDWLMMCVVIINVVCLWWFLLETGLFAATWPRTLSMTGAVVILWVVPVLTAVFWGGYKIAAWGWEYYMADLDIYRYGSNAAFSYSTYSLLNTMWYMVHFIVLLLIFTLYLYFNSIRHMDFRRRGRWG